MSNPSSLSPKGSGATTGIPLTDPVPQSEPLDERQVQNSAGGYAYPVDDMTRLRRFLSWRIT